MTTTTYHPIGTTVRYSGRLYRVLSVKLGEIAGPHYRLAAMGDHQNEDLTSHQSVIAVETTDTSGPEIAARRAAYAAGSWRRDLRHERAMAD